VAATGVNVVGREDELAALADFLDVPPPPRILLLEEARYGSEFAAAQSISPSIPNGGKHP
jgi:hypothetical protein